MINNQRNRNVRTQAFTLLEILLVIFIISVFSGLSLPYFNASTNTKKLDQEAKQLIDVIELAKAKSSASEAVIPGCNIFRGYRVFFDNPSTQYRLRACCTNSAAPAQLCTTFRDIQTYQLQSGHSLTLSGSLTPPNTYIHFPNLKLGTTLNSNAVIRVNNVSINKCIRITVDRLGLVTESQIMPLPC